MRQAVTKYRVSLLLTSLSLLVLSFSFFQAKLNLTGYGLISTLPYSFYAALILLIIAAALLWISEEKHYWLLGLQTTILIVSLYLISYIIEGTARFPAAYQNYGFAESVIRTGHLDPVKVWYHSYPGFPLYFASFFQVLGIQDPMITMAIFPALMEILFLLPLFLIFRNVKGTAGNMWWLAAWIFIIANWTNQEYFSPQAMAYLLLLYFFTIVFKNVSGPGSITNSVLMVILIIALTITHMVTSIMALLVLGGLTILWRKKEFTSTILFVTVIGAWTIFGGIILTKIYLPVFFEQAFQPDQLFFFTYLFRFVETSTEHALINNIRVLFTAFFVFIAAIGALWPNRENRKSKINLSFLVIALCPIIMIPAFVYAGEFVIRVFLFLLIPITYFIIKLIRTKIAVVIFAVLLTLLIPVHIAAHYGNDKAERIPVTELKATDFFFSNSTQGRVLGLIPPLLYKEVGQYAFYILYSATPDPEYVDRISTMESKPPPGQLVHYSTQYVIFCDRMYDMYGLFLNNADRIVQARAWINTATQYDLIYSNHDVELFIWD